MKLKIKLPLLFMLMFLIFLLLGFLYIRFFMLDERYIWHKAISASAHMGIFMFLLIVTGIMFGILSIHFHFSITRPLQILNERLKNVNIGYLRPSLSYNKKDEIGELYNHFNEMEERLHQVHKEQIDMIAAIAHDLKTPLTTINGFVELLSMQQDLSEKERQEYYALILKKSRHIAELINSFSSFTRDQLELETIDMKKIEAIKFFESIATEYEIELSGLGYELKWSHSYGAEHTLMINEHMMRRVFGNLFSNAVRYGERNDLKIYMSGFIHGQYVIAQIEDNGPGVPDKDLPSLFNKFFTVDKSRQNKSGGTGLGLASSKSIIERHGGEISAFHSGYGGMGIRITLPIVPS